MPEKIIPIFEGVAKTNLITLYTRAVESQRPNGLIKDDRAVAIVRQMDFDFSQIKLHGHDEVTVILRMKEFDRLACEFLAHNPDGVVVHIGCGLDTRFERVDNGQTGWYDLDLPEVIELRRTLIGGERDRYHLLSSSVFDDEWLEPLNLQRHRPFLFMAEGVLAYFEENQVRSLVLTLRDHFPGAELVCDAYTPFAIWANNLQLALAGVDARMHWGLKHPKDMESWDDGIEMLYEWFYFDRPEPRLGPAQWMRHFPLLAKSAGIFHYRLGSRT
jgi:O-methyltransferase involved in polyketide biosynthesis